MSTTPSPDHDRAGGSTPSVAASSLAPGDRDVAPGAHDVALGTHDVVPGTHDVAPGNAGIPGTAPAAPGSGPAAGGTSGQVASGPDGDGARDRHAAVDAPAAGAPIGAAGTTGQALAGARPRRGRHRRTSHRSGRGLRRWARRHRILATLGVVLVLLTPVWWSAVTAATNPSLGSSLPARMAEWVRGHGGSSIVAWAENLWYSHHPPPVGGKPARGAIPPPVAARATTSVPPATAAAAAALPPPAPIVPIASPPVAGEGQWHPAGRTVDGIPAVYEAYLRPDSVHTSVVVGVAWMDTRLLRSTLYSGSTIPGGGPWAHTAPVSPTAAQSLVAAFNAGFLMSNANGGYYTQGRVVDPLRTGAASFVIYSDGSATVGTWGTDVHMGPDVVSVRQNLRLIVDHGAPVPGLNANDTSVWGATLGNQVYVWRSGVGVTADGALVYVGGPDLNITDLANVLARAGAVRAMELDINTDWVNFTAYTPSAPSGPATPQDGATLLSSMTGGPGRYFASWWSRDFFTMSARSSPLATPGDAGLP